MHTIGLTKWWGAPWSTGGWEQLGRGPSGPATTMRREPWWRPSRKLPSSSLTSSCATCRPSPKLLQVHRCAFEPCLQCLAGAILDGCCLERPGKRQIDQWWAGRLSCHGACSKLRYIELLSWGCILIHLVREMAGQAHAGMSSHMSCRCCWNYSCMLPLAIAAMWLPETPIRGWAVAFSCAQCLVFGFAVAIWLLSISVENDSSKCHASYHRRVVNWHCFCRTQHISWLQIPMRR